MYRVWIERIQRRYPKSWRFIKGVRRAIERHGERVRSIAWNYTHKVSDRIAELTSEHSLTIVLENLGHLGVTLERAQASTRATTLVLQGIQFAIAYEALERGLEVKQANPRNTSSTCPKRRNKLRNNDSRVLYCISCEFTEDRDVIACANPFFRYLIKCRGSGRSDAPKLDEALSEIRRNQMM